MRLLILLLLSCSPRIIRIPTSQVQRVEIVKLPELDACYMPELPDPPEQMLTASEDVMKRMHIHRREFEDLLEHLRWWRHWAEYIQECLKDRAGLP